MKLILLIMLMSLSAQARISFSNSQHMPMLSELKNPGFENGKTGWASVNSTISTVNWSSPSVNFGKKYFEIRFARLF